FQRAVAARRVVRDAQAGVLLRGKAGLAGEEHADAAHEDELVTARTDSLIDRNAARQRADAARLALGEQARDETVAIRRSQPLALGDVRWDVLGINVEAAGPRLAVRPNCGITVGVLDGEEVHLRREGNTGREVALDTDGGNEAGTV